MLIKSEYDIQFHLQMPTPMVAMLHVHPSLEPRVRSGNALKVEHIDRDTKSDVAMSEFHDVFGNRCTRFMTPAGAIRLSGMSVVEMEALADPIHAYAQQARVEDLPSEVLQFLLPSRYCEVDQFGPIAQDLFGWMTPGWTRASAIRDWVHEKVSFNYKAARPTKTAMDIFVERVGVCRDYQASGDCAVTVPEYSGAVCNGVPGGHSCALLRAGRFQRVVRGVSRWALDDDGCPA